MPDLVLITSGDKREVKEKGGYEAYPPDGMNTVFVSCFDYHVICYHHLLQKEEGLLGRKLLLWKQ